MSKRSKVYDYDLISIGSGAGGGVAAHVAVRDGKKVAVVEADTIGGDCPNYACTPTKAMLTAAETFKTVKESDKFGISTTTVRINQRRVKAWKDLAVKRTGAGVGDRAFSAEGIAVIKGQAHFLDKHTISVRKKRFTARYFLIATGSHSYVPPIEGLNEAGFLTYREVINLTRLPRSVFIIGGGAVGLEFANYFTAVGTRVVMAEFAPHLHAREDPEVGELLQALLEREGAKVMTSTEVYKVETRGGKKIVHYKSGNKKSYAQVDEVMVATGMHPNLDLGLENAGVEYSKHGIYANSMMQTNVKHIYTAGDVTGPYGFTHMASYQSRVAVHNMFKRHKVVAKYHAVPRVIFANLETATVGLTEDQLKRQGLKYKTHIVPIDILGRANVTDMHEGFAKIIASHTGVILGAAIVAPRAGEMIHELALAVNLGLTVHDVASTIHAFPTWSEAVRACAAGMDLNS